jgi:hypothetical protein
LRGKYADIAILFSSEKILRTLAILNYATIVMQNAHEPKIRPMGIGANQTGLTQEKILSV